MTATTRLVRTIATDRRIIGLSLVCVGWAAVGSVVSTGFVVEPAVLVVYSYLLVLSAFTQSFPGTGAFWLGFCLYCFGVSAVLVSAFDAFRAWYTTRHHSDREPAIGK